jgi:phosphocarrier protein HPr
VVKPRDDEELGNHVREKTLNIQNKLGLHIRAANKLVQAASSYASEITLTYQQQTVQAKNIMEVITLAVPGEAEIVLKVSGEDEHNAFTAMLDLINNKFGEEE